MARYSSLALLLLCLCCISHTKAQNSGFSVELIHHDSPRSPFYNPTETKFQRVANAVLHSINRAYHHFNKVSVPTNTPQTTTVPDGFGGGYLMRYSIGTPPFHLYGLVDTASNIVWMQCKPCENCFKQTTPMFDPSKSTTYKTIPCSSATCKSLPGSTCSSNSNKQICEYFIAYADDSQSQGALSLETLTLGSTNGSHVSFPRTIIGCGHNDTGFRGRTSGIVGLGVGPTSLISQLGSSIGGKLSYCLVPAFSGSNSSSKLSFGNHAVVSGHGTVSTPILPDRDENNFYYLIMEAFSVGDKRIKFRNSSSGSSKKGNIFIDSGTTLTFLPHDVYSRLESAVAKVVKLKRAKDPSKQLSLCYVAKLEQLKVPIITAHFRGADVQLSALNTFIQADDEVVCFAFTSNIAIGTIFGNVAQQNLLIGYDLQKKVLSFKPTDCTKH